MRDASRITHHSSRLTPHSSLLTPHSSLITPQVWQKTANRQPEVWNKVSLNAGNLSILRILHKGDSAGKLPFLVLRSRSSISARLRLQGRVSGGVRAGTVIEDRKSIVYLSGTLRCIWHQDRPDSDDAESG